MRATTGEGMTIGRSAPPPTDWRKVLSFAPNPADRIIALRDGTEVLVVIHRTDSQARRERAYKVIWWLRGGRYGKAHDPYDTSTARDYHAFIAREDRMAVGCMLIVRPQITPTLQSWQEPTGHTPALRQPRTTPAWRIAFVGVLESRRRRGKARLLIEEAARFFNIEVCQFGWGLPFQPDGMALARALCPRAFWSA